MAHKGKATQISEVDAYAKLKGRFYSINVYGNFSPEVTRILTRETGVKIDDFIRDQAKKMSASGYYEDQVDSYVKQAQHDWALTANPAANGGVKGLAYLADQIKKGLNQGLTVNDFTIPTADEIKQDVTNQLVKQAEELILKNLTPEKAELLYQQNPGKYTIPSRTKTVEGPFGTSRIITIPARQMTVQEMTGILIQSDVIPSAKFQEEVDKCVTDFTASNHTRQSELWADLSSAAGEQRTVDWERQKARNSEMREKVYGPTRIMVGLALATSGVPVLSQIGMADVTTTMSETGSEMARAKREHRKFSWKPTVKASPIPAIAAGVLSGVDYLSDLPKEEEPLDPNKYDVNVDPVTGETTMTEKTPPDVSEGGWDWDASSGTWKVKTKDGYTWNPSTNKWDLLPTDGTSGIDIDVKKLTGMDKDFWEDLAETLASIAAEKIVRDKERRQLGVWYDQRTADIRAELGRQEAIGLTAKTRTEEDYGKAMEALSRAKHLQNIQTREELAQRGITPSAASTIGTSQWGRVGAEQQAAQTGIEQQKGRRVEDIERELAEARAQEERALREAEHQKNLTMPTWGNILQSRVSPAGIVGAGEKLLGIGGDEKSSADYYTDLYKQYSNA